jgi:hypothetical protein
MGTPLRIALFTLLPALCLAADTKVYSQKDADFSRYKTYQWLPSKVMTKTGVVEGDPVVAPLIAKAVKEQLAKKGFTEVTENPDVTVATLALAESVPQLEALIFAPYDGATWGTAPLASVGRYNREGSLVVNIVDPRTNKSLWTGLTRRTISKKEPGEHGPDLDKAANDLFKKYPPKK